MTKQEMMPCSFCGRSDGTHNEESCPAYRNTLPAPPSVDGLVKVLDDIIKADGAPRTINKIAREALAAYRKGRGD
jgi:hypothetical protein